MGMIRFEADLPLEMVRSGEDRGVSAAKLI